VLFVVEWEKTADTAAENGLKALPKSRAPVIGATLTQVNMRRHAKYGYNERRPVSR
jgi:polysaccharide biosynthesis transport protein